MKSRFKQWQIQMVVAIVLAICFFLLAMSNY
jgi:hypothetical protein